jgi:hypothetical protein
MGWQGLRENSNKFVKDSSGRLGKQIVGSGKIDGKIDGKRVLRSML